MTKQKQQEHTLPPGAAHAPAQWEDADAGAFQALVRGECPPHLQQRALEWLLNSACRIRDLSYQPGDPVATAFAEGRRFVGLQVAKMLSLNLGKLRQSHGGHPDEQQ